MLTDDIKLLAFDADDTLWDCQSHFVAVEEAYCRLLSDYGSADEISQALFATETADMPLLGYGCKAFTISLVENAIVVSSGKVDAATIMKVVGLGRSLLEAPATPLPEVRATLSGSTTAAATQWWCSPRARFSTRRISCDAPDSAVFSTMPSSLPTRPTTSTTVSARATRVSMQQMMMIGNSFKSDIEPVLQLGGTAAHIPFHVLWQYEKTEEYDHERLFRLQHFGELAPLLL